MDQNKLTPKDRKFAEAMIANHKAALSLAMGQIEDGAHPYLQHVAVRVMQSHSGELDDLQGWLNCQCD